MKTQIQRAAIAAAAVLGLATSAWAAGPQTHGALHAAKASMAKKTTTSSGTGGAATMADVAKADGPVVTGKHVRFITSKGTFEIVLFPKVAPKTVDNFMKLVKNGFFNGTTFHRVIPGFVAQGGDPLSKTKPVGDPSIGTGGAGANIPDEFSPKMHHLVGSLAMAHSMAPNSASSQFYVCFKPLTMLDGKYCVFGQVTKGMDVVNKLQPTERDSVPIQNVKPDKMIKVVLF